MDGEEASNQIKEQKPDIVLLDILLPKKNGLEVLQEMKEDPEVSNTPVLLLGSLTFLLASTGKYIHPLIGS